MNYADQKLNRKMQFEDALLALMGEMPYEKISVKDLTERMGVARKTFYQYFPGKRACLEALVDRTIYAGDLYVLQTVPKGAPEEEAYATRLSFWMEHKALLDAIIQNGLGDFFLERTILFVHRENPGLPARLDRPGMPSDGDILYFCLSGQVCLLLRWCREGFCQPVEDMVRKTLRLLHEPLLAP